MSSFSRRDFLKTATMSLALLAGDGLILDPFRRAWAEGAPAGLNELLVLCDTLQEVGRDPSGITTTNPGSVKVLEVASGKSFSIDVPFFGHAVIQNPRIPHQLVTFEKWGRRAALVDLKEKAVLASAAPFDGNVFFGHAVFVSGGSVLVNTEDSYGRDSGHLFLRDPASLKIIQKYPTFGVKPHECRLGKDDRTVMVIHEGRKGNPSNISWVEMSSGKLLHKVMLNFEARASFAHLDVSHDGWICASGGTIKTEEVPVKTLVTFVSPEGKVTQPHIPADVAARMRGEGLSIAFLGKSGLVAVTIPNSNTVVVFDYKKQEFVGSAVILKVNGVVPDLTATEPETSMIVSSAVDKDLITIKTLPGSNVLEPAVSQRSFGGNGAHLARLYV